MDFLGKPAWRQNLTIEAIFKLYEISMVNSKEFQPCLPLQELRESRLKVSGVHSHHLLLTLQNIISTYSSPDLYGFMFAFLPSTNS